MSRARRVLLRALSAAFVVAAASSARAQTNLPQTVAAKGLYDQAVLAIGRNDYEPAYRMLEEALRLEPAALGARMALAECYEAADRLVSAWGMFGIVEQEALKAKQPDRQKTAHDRAAALEPRLAHLVVEVPDVVSRLPGLTIERDGVSVGNAQWGVPLPADKGSHFIAIGALGRRRVVLTFEVLADGVTARAILPEPPPVSPGAAWWEAPSAPPAPRRSSRELPRLQPPPPPPVPGIATVDLAAPPGLALCEPAPSGGPPRCAAGGMRVDARAGQAFFLRGEGFLDSEGFRLDDQTGRVTIQAAPASRSTRTFSVVLMALGSAATLPCGIGLPVAAQSSTGTAPAVGACLFGGLVSLGVGLPLFFLTRTTYSITSNHTSFNAGSLHF